MQAAASQTQTAKKPTVMIADGYADTRYLLRFWLEKEGYDVSEAANGDEALQFAEGVRPDLILMSLRMPVLDGFEATRRIRGRDPVGAPPIVAVSTHPTERERALALDAGCDEFIGAPIDFDGLGDLLCHLLPAAAGRQLPGGQLTARWQC